MCHLGVSDLILLDKDEGGRDQRALTHVVHRIVGHRLQQPQRLLRNRRRDKTLFYFYLVFFFYLVFLKVFNYYNYDLFISLINYLLKHNFNCFTYTSFLYTVYTFM